jgi:hypothetical protein
MATTADISRPPGMDQLAAGQYPGMMKVLRGIPDASYFTIQQNYQDQMKKMSDIFSARGLQAANTTGGYTSGLGDVTGFQSNLKEQGQNQVANFMNKYKLDRWKSVMASLGKVSGMGMETTVDQQLPNEALSTIGGGLSSIGFGAAGMGAGSAMV